MRPYTGKDVKIALFQIDSNKSPGLDGFSSGFFKSAWSIVGEDISKDILQFFQNEMLLKQLNTTNIALIPKVDDPEYASQFRPISCCNVLYKIISNMICVRLKKVISVIVEENQAEFV